MLSRTQLGLLKKALRAMPSVREQRSVDDVTNLAISIDLDDFISKREPGYLTEYQYLVLTRVLFEGYSEIELAEELKVSQQAISYAMTTSLNKISSYLLNQHKVPPPPLFSVESKELMVSMYNEGASAKEIAIALDLRLSTVRNKIRQLRERGVLVGKTRAIRANKQKQIDSGNGS